MARLLGGEDTAALIDRLTEEMAEAATGIHALALEAAAASAYWFLWADLRMNFARRDRVPDHWCVFGSRRPSRADPESRSGMSRSNRPRNAPSAPVALINYLFGLAASQMTIAVAEVGLDPGIGIFHADQDGRASLAYDAIEPLRPYIEAWLLCCLAEVRFAKRDFYEDGDGTIRITRPLTSWLALSAPLWRARAEVVARWLADSFAGFARLGDRGGFGDEMMQAAGTGATTLPVRTAQKAVKTRVARHALRPLPEPLPSLPAPGRTYKPALAHEVLPRVCHECGRALVPSKSQPHTASRRKFCSGSCAAVYRAEDAAAGAARRTKHGDRGDPRDRGGPLRQAAAACRGAERMGWRPQERRSGVAPVVHRRGRAAARRSRADRDCQDNRGVSGLCEGSCPREGAAPAAFRGAGGACRGRGAPISGIAGDESRRDLLHRPRP